MIETTKILPTFPFRSIRTRSGTFVDVFDSKPEDFHIEDIAHALSNLCRYGGHCDPFYSVAQHSIACSYMVSKKNALCALLHDATEAYLVDMPRPIKKQLEIYTELENNLYTVIAKRFDLPNSIPDEVHWADNEILNYEWYYFMENTPVLDQKPFYSKFFKKKSCKIIKKQFIERYEMLLTLKS